MDYSRYETLKIENEGGITTVTLNRPDVLNAIYHGGEGVEHREVEDIWLDLADDPEVNIVVLTGAGRAFSAGGNIKGMADAHGTERGWYRAVNSTRTAKRLVANMLDFHKPLVCAINGHCMGLGATIALLSDTVVIAEKAKIGDTHVRVGLVAGDGGTVTWPMLIGPGRAKDFLMRGRVIDGKEAERIGLVAYAVPTEEVLPKAMEIAEELASLPPLAVRWTKTAINQNLKAQFNMVMDSSIALEALSMVSKDHGEATHAFVEKRDPTYTGE